MRYFFDVRLCGAESEESRELRISKFNGNCINSRNIQLLIEREGEVLQRLPLQNSTLQHQPNAASDFHRKVIFQ